MKHIHLLLFGFFLFSCSINKRHYQKGFHIEWKGTKEASINTARRNAERNDTLSKLINLPNSLNTSANDKEAIANIIQPNSELIASNIKEPKLIKSKHLLLVGDSVLIQKSNEYFTRKLAKSSYTLGIITLLSTILVFFYIFTVPTAIICGIIAIRRGKKAIKLMGNDIELNKKYRKKAVIGIKLGMSFFYFLITAFHIGLLGGFVVLVSYLVLGIALNTGAVEGPIIIAAVLCILAAILIVKLYLLILKKLKNTIPTIKAPL